MATIRWDGKNTVAASWDGAGIGEFCLIEPGVHDVDDDAWENAKTTGKVQAMITSGKLIEIEDARPTGDNTVSPLGAPKTLVKFSIAEAITLVNAETSEDILKGWKKKEKRKDVKDAINDRLEEL